MRLLPSVLAVAPALLLAAPLGAQGRHEGCEEELRDLILDTLAVVGEARLSNGDQYIRIEVSALAPWKVAGMRAFVDYGPPPEDAQGNPDVGSFPYQATFDPGPRRALYVPMADLGLSFCLETVMNVSVQVELVELDAFGNVANADTAWVDGVNSFSGTVFGRWFPWLTCCEDCGGPMTLTPHPPVFKRGRVNALEAGNGPAGKVVRFLANDGTIGCSGGRLLDQLGLQALDLLSPVTLLGSRTADPTGTAVLDFDLPLQVSPGLYGFQAFVFDGVAGISSVKSQAIVVQVD